MRHTIEMFVLKSSLRSLDGNLGYSGIAIDGVGIVEHFAFDRIIIVLVRVIDSGLNDLS